MEALTTENPTLGDVTSIVSVFASGGTKEAAIAEGWKSFYGRGGSITSKVRAIMTANPGMSHLAIKARFKLHATPPKLLLSSNNANIIDDFEHSWHVRLRGLKGTGVWQEYNSKGSCYSKKREATPTRETPFPYFVYFWSSPSFSEMGLNEVSS